MEALFSPCKPQYTFRLVFPSPFSPRKFLLRCPFPRRNLTLQPLAHPSSPSDSTDLELLGKPSPILVPPEPDEPKQPPNPEEAIAPFLKFFGRKKNPTAVDPQESDGEKNVSVENYESDGENKVAVEYYEPKPGDLVVGVVVSGNEQRMDVNVGSDILGTMLTKEALPLEPDGVGTDLRDLSVDAEELTVRGRAAIVKDEDGLGKRPPSGRPVIEVGTVLFAEVLGRTLSGRPLLSARRMFRRVAWHRVRQLKQLNEPIEVRIDHWNTAGLVARIEGLRAFLPKEELMKKTSSFTELKKNVGRHILVAITKVDEDTNNLVISEKVGWDMSYLQEGTLLDGVIWKLYPYGARVNLGGTTRSALLHVSKITHKRIRSVTELLKEGDKVKVLVIKSLVTDKMGLSIADLESEPGLFVSNREKVFSEAEEMAKIYRSKIPGFFTERKFDPPTEALPFDDESKLYANWKWFKFELDNEKQNSDDKDVDSGL